MKNLFLKFYNQLLLKILILILFFAFIMIGYFFISSKSNFKEYLKAKAPNIYTIIRDEIIYPIFKQKVIGASLVENIPMFKLVLSRKDVAHFAELHRKYEIEGGLGYYSQNNQWKKAELFYKGKRYKIKIKAHGRNPSGHKAGKYISFGIKLRGNYQINNANRFNLLIHERIDPRYSLTMDMASRFDLLIQKQELVNLKINDWEEKLYYFEHRLNSSFMEAQGNSPLKLFKYDVSEHETEDKSLILAEKRHINDFDPLLYSQMFKESLEAEGFIGKNGEELLERYLALNQAIVNNKSQEIHYYFDEDYITSFNAVRLILGYIGHGSVRGNLYIFFNMANGKFYPVLTRDHLPDYLPKNGAIENKINDWKLPWDTNKTVKLPLFHLLSQNDHFRQITYKKLFHFIRQEEYRLPKIHKKTVIDLQKIYYLGWLKEVLRVFGIGEFKDITKTNFKLLKQYLNDAKPQINLSGKEGKLLISLKPKSMSGLKIKKFLIQLPSTFANQSLRLTQLSWFEPNKTIINTDLVEVMVKVGPKAQIDLQKTLSEVSFFDALDNESLPLSRNYQIIIQANHPNLDWSKYLVKKNIEVEFLNLVTGKVVTENSVNLIGTRKESSFTPPSARLFPKSQKKQNWKKVFPQAYKEGNEVKIPKGDYFLSEDLIFPRGSQIVLNAGTKITLAKGVGLLIQGSLIVEGTKEQPVIITAVKPKEAFGTFAVLGTGKEISRINYLKLSHGNEKWMNGAYFSGAFALHYQKEVTIENSEFIEGQADDGVNIKFSKVYLKNNVFKNNFADQMDLDYCEGFVLDSSFLYDINRDKNGDGLDISGSQIYASGNLFSKFNDKGISAGEKSHIFITNNHFKQNNVGSAVKDFSIAYYLRNHFSQNLRDIQVYQKKKIYGGGRIYLKKGERKTLKTSLDKRSKALFFPMEIEKKVPWILNPPKYINHFFTQLEGIEYNE
jgi:hypothetical protein